MASVLTPEQRSAFDRDGYALIRGLFDRDEAAILAEAIEQDPAIRSHFYDKGDAEGGRTKMALWNHPGDSVYGMAARSLRVVDTLEDVLGGEVYHYHSKLTAKDAFEGGAWEWHQDYGYWYNNGILFPHMASVMIALDRASRDNGCLQVLKGSHHLGRIEHGQLDGGQVGVDMRRIEEALKRLELVYCEMKPGDGLFFHANTLHRSDANRSPNRRWTLLCCYNLASNNPYREHHHPSYTKLDKVPDSAIKAMGVKFASLESQAAFMKKSSGTAEKIKQSGKLFAG